jgi:dTMP kinase
VGQALSAGRFITFEGGEGAGKTTQIKLLAAFLTQAGIEPVTTREPGGAPGAEEIRRLLLTGEPGRWDAESEALLMVAARRSHLVATVWPALTAGRIVLCDRFMDSTEAYQGWGRGLPREAIVALHRLIAGDFAPDLTFILDLPVADGLARTATRPGNETRFERMGYDFHERLRLGFLDIARREPQRCVLIDAGADAAAVHERIVATVRDRLGIAAPPA